MRILTSSALVLAVALALAACTTTNEIEGHQIRADGQAVTTNDLQPGHRGRPSVVQGRLATLPE